MYRIIQKNSIAKKILFWVTVLPETGYTRRYYLGSEKQTNILGEIAFMTYYFIWDQNSRPGVDGLNIYLMCYSLLALETFYTRGYYLGNEEHKSLFPLNRLCVLY